MSEQNVLSVLGCESGEIDKLHARDKVFALEAKVKELPQVKLPLRHFFSGDIYVGEMFIPANHVLTGHIHLYEHIAICSSGDISIYDETGLHRVKAGDIFVSKPGIKRAGFAHEDTRFINVLPMLEPWPRDWEDYASKFTVETYEEYDAFLKEMNHVVE